MAEIGKKGIVETSRTGFLIVLVTLSFLLFVIRLFGMQIVDEIIYTSRARVVTQRSVPIVAERGLVYDRNYGDPLAANRESFAVTITPAELQNTDRDVVFALLSEYLGISRTEMEARLPERRIAAYQAIEIANGINLETITKLAEHIDTLPGVSWYSKPRRVYTQGELLANVLGYVGDITPEELQVLFNEGYNANATIGKSGIEQQYDELLRGIDGQRFRTVDARGRRVDEEEDMIPPERGKNLVLTIDTDLQRLAAAALGERIGSVVVLKPNTGEILALVSYPRFDPNVFINLGGDETFRNLALDPRAPFLNRPIQALAAPASTFKVLMTVAVLEEDAFPPDEQVACNGQLEYGNRTFNCWLSYGHGLVDLYDGLAQSCNVYFWTVGTEYLGVDTIIEYCSHLGLGQLTGVDLPGEVAGLVPSPLWKEQVFNTRWVGGDTVNMSIGEGFLQVTSLQLANMVSTIVNDGVVYVPHVLKEVRNPVTGRVIERREPEVLRETNISQETYEQVREAMRGVITRGTAEVVITTDAVAVAGKTGTGQTGREDHLTSWFVAFAPYGEDVNPDDQIVLAVKVDAANDWEWWAPKAANIILHGYFRGLDFEQAIADLRQGSKPLWYM